MTGLQKAMLKVRGTGRLALGLAIVSGVVACSDGPATEREGAGSQAGAEEECGGLITRSDIQDAFDGALTVQSTTVAAMGSEVAGCLLMIEEGINTRLNFTVGDLEDFNTRKDSQLRQTGGTHEAFDAGAEAHIFNGYYVIAVMEDGRSVSLGLSPKAIKEAALLSPEESATGMKLLAERIVSRLGAQ